MGYAVSSQGTWFDFITTPTGFSVVPTSITFRYTLIGKLCSWYCTMGGDGTSNATSFTITVPFAAKTGANAFGLIASVVNNTVTATTPGRIQYASGSNIATLAINSGGSAWTASGGKRILMQGFYEID